MTMPGEPPSGRRPTDADFDAHQADLEELDRIRSRRARLPPDAPDHDVLAARERAVRRRIHDWVGRFTTLPD